MILIVVALEIEALPLVELFKLKRVHTIHTHQVFQNEDITLIISGPGKVAAATAVSRLCSLKRDSKLISKPHLINIGFAAHKDAEIGTLFLVHKITDFQSQKIFLPEMYLKTNISENELLTCDTPQTNIQSRCLIDMEASGFFEAGACYVSNANMHCLKIVSDNGSDALLSKKIANTLINNVSESLFSYGLTLQKHRQRTSSLLMESEYNELYTKMKNIGFSKSQIDALEECFLSYLVHGGTFEHIKSLLHGKPLSKTERSKFQKELFKTLVQ